MNQKELNEIRRRFKLDKNAISKIYGCYVNSNREIISYYNKFWLEAQHPAGLLSFSCLSYNEGEQPADHYLLGLLCP